jgi:D-alanine-D-alanine ligase
VDRSEAIRTDFFSVVSDAACGETRGGRTQREEAGTRRTRRACRQAAARVPGGILAAMPTSPRAHVILLFGGRSAEHDVSTITALHVLGALDRERYEVTPIGITRDGRWIDARGDLAAIESRSARALPSPDTSTGAEIAPTERLTRGSADLPTVVLPLLHGPMGEDGTVQGLLELADLPYVGAGVLASAICMDKPTSKRLLRAEGIPVVPWVAARRHRAGDELVERVESALDYPVFVKPSNMGSSVGVSKASSRDELRHAIEVALRYDEHVIVEQGIEAREIEVAVLGNEEPAASLPGEIEPSHDFYDYADKYLEEGAGLLVPADLTTEQVKEAQQLAIRAYEALRVDGMARVDFFFDEGGRGFVVNELNTIPGFTPISMFPRLWEASGLPYPALIDRLIELALQRHAGRSGFSTSPSAP